MTLAEGSHLGAYRIVAPLGAGGMGEVYRAADFVANSAGISRVSSTGGTPTSLIASDRAQNLRHLLPHALPGGKAIVFTTVTGGGWDTANIVLLSVESGEQRVLVKGGADARYIDTGHLVYAKAGTLMAVPFSLRAQQVSGSAVAVLEGVMQSVNTLNSSDETGAAQFSVSTSGTLVWPGEKIRVSTDSSGGGTEPVWAPGGRELLYRGFGSQAGVFSVTISSVSPFSRRAAKTHRRDGHRRVLLDGAHSQLERQS